MGLKKRDLLLAMTSAWWLVSSTMMAVPLVGAELEVHSSRYEEGAFWLKRTDGSSISFVISQRGPAQPREPDGIGDCVRSDWPRDGFELVVSRGNVVSTLRDIAIIPLRTPVTVTEIRAVESDDSVQIALRCDYECSHHRGQSYETSFVVVEIAPNLRLLRQSRIETGGRVCFPGDVATAQASLEPGFEVRDGELWFKVGLRSFVCWAGGERRGWYEWVVGQQPVAVDPAEFEGIVELARQAQELGFQPYRRAPFGADLTALWAESPYNLGGARFLGLQHSSGARTVVLLPRNGFSGGREWYVENTLPSPGGSRSRGLVGYLEEEWPEAASVRAFHWSDNFLAAREGQQVRLVLAEGPVQIFELEMPCLRDGYPAPTNNSAERWIVRTERIDGDLRAQAALLETCADHLAILAGDSAVGFPESHVEIDGRDARVHYDAPRFDVGPMERSKFLFDWLDAIESLYPYQEVVMGLDHEPELIARSSPTTPTEGAGWAVLRRPTCQFRISSYAGADYRIAVEPGSVPPRLVRTGDLESVCLESESPGHWCTFSGKITTEGSIVDLVPTSCSRDLPENAKNELQTFVEAWAFEPARDPGGEAIPGRFAVEVYPKQPQTQR